MATITPVSDLATVGTSEHYLISDSTTMTPQTTDQIVLGYLDVSALAAGDQFQVTVYEKANGGTATAVDPPSILAGEQSTLFEIKARLLGSGYDIGVKKLAGTDRSIGWTLFLITPS